MQDEFQDNQEDYSSLTHEYWCEILSTIEVKDNRKRSSTQIKNITSARSVSHSDSNESIKVLRKNKSRTGALHNNPNRKAPKHNGNQRHCVLCKKSGIPEQNYMSHIDEDCFGKRSNKKSIRYRLRGLI